MRTSDRSDVLVWIAISVHRGFDCLIGCCLIIQMAGDLPIAVQPQRRNFAAADRHGGLTARVKWTAGRGGGDARHLALKEHVIAGALDLRVRHRYRIEKNARVGMERFAVEVVAVTWFP